MARHIALWFDRLIGAPFKLIQLPMAAAISADEAIPTPYAPRNNSAALPPPPQLPAWGPRRLDIVSTSYPFDTNWACYGQSSIVNSSGEFLCQCHSPRLSVSLLCERAEIIVTPNAGSQTGSCWYQPLMTMSGTFTVNFTLVISSTASPADGMAFVRYVRLLTLMVLISYRTCWLEQVLQSTSNTYIGDQSQGGNGLGLYLSNTALANSLCLVFDWYRNTNALTMFWAAASGSGSSSVRKTLMVAYETECICCNNADLLFN
jgi:hypothetical protein